MKFESSHRVRVPVRVPAWVWVGCALIRRLEWFLWIQMARTVANDESRRPSHEALTLRDIVRRSTVTG